MSYSGESLVGALQTVLPPISNRTLHHPSFLPLYRPTCFHHHFHGDVRPGYPLSPAELFYTDPTLPCGRRIYTSQREMVFDCSQLNTPLPIMSAYVTPPSGPDPFRAAPHPTYNLGSPSWRTRSIHSPEVQPRLVVIQLTQQEDQVITNLLKLHHQEAPQRNEGITTVHDDFPGSVESKHEDYTASFQGADKVFWVGALEVGRRWSDAEYEAANTLLSSFNQMDDYWIEKSSTPADHLLLPASDTELERQTFSATVTGTCSPNGSCINEDIGSEEEQTPCSPVFESKLEPEKSLHSNKESGSEDRMLTDLEGDAVQVLLSLRDVITFSARE